MSVTSKHIRYIYSDFLSADQSSQKNKIVRYVALQEAEANAF